ncbi:MAG: FAD binding domain-containing protein [Anaerolineae bacterium]|nr:FAD binding domain-containing protein [Anaerolineae bacterium]
MTWAHYFSVASVDEALQLLAEHGARARIVAGATDLIIELERKIRPGVDTLIDVSRVSGLDGIAMHDGRIRIGPLVTHNHLVGSPIIREHAFPLARAAWDVGAPQIRNRGTVAGNLITASPANDTIPPLWALGAAVTLRSLSGGERTLSLPDFYTGLRKTAMRPDEMLTAIEFPALAANERGAFLKLALRRAQAISVVNAAVVLGFDPNGERVTRAVITLGSVAPTIVRAQAAEAFLIGKALSDETIREAARLALGAATPIGDVRATAEYRSAMIGVLVARALRSLRDRTERDGFPDDPAMLWGPHQAHVTPDVALPGTLRHDGQPIETTINGTRHTISGATHKTLLRMLREDAHLPGTKEGCAEGECGACTVFLDGVAVMACMVPAPRAHGAHIVTVEGVAQDGQLHPVQQAFVETGAVQCGYCTPGFVMSGVKLLEEHAAPTAEQVEQSITGNLCRCTGYYRIVQAIEKAAQLAAESTVK